MRLLGVDFTSAPSPRKPITAAWGDLLGGVLTVNEVQRLGSFAEFEALLETPGPWVGGFDFPFGMPAEYVRAQWGDVDWRSYVGAVGLTGREAFVTRTRAYGRELFRPCDRAAKACSPMKMFFVPVGRMFHAGAPRLAASGASIVPCAPTASNRIVLEAYPALVAKALIGTSSYKPSNKTGYGSERRDSRRALIAALGTPSIYGFPTEIRVPVDLEEPDGDELDAVLALIQAAWASRQPDYGIPLAADPREGWIVDPSLLNTPLT